MVLSDGAMDETPRGVELDWGLFSLERQNAGKESGDQAASHAHSARGLRTAVAVRNAAGRSAVGAFYKELGRRVHEQGQTLDEPATVEGALADAGLDPGLCAAAWADPSTAEEVASEHRHLCEQTRSIGVPTIVLDGGTGPVIFGPVLSEPPNDDDAVELWKHVSWLVRGHRPQGSRKVAASQGAARPSRQRLTVGLCREFGKSGGCPGRPGDRRTGHTSDLWPHRPAAEE